MLFFWQKGAAFIFCVLCALWLARAYFESGKTSLGFLAVFFYSLKGEAVITRLARLKEKNIDEKVVSYTRGLTKIWCWFFVFNAVFTFVLAQFEDKIYWSIYCSFVSYILMGVLFFGEILYRKIFILKRENGF